MNPVRLAMLGALCLSALQLSACSDKHSRPDAPRNVTATRVVTATSREYVSLPAAVTERVPAPALPDRPLFTADLHTVIDGLAGALRWANLKLRVAACLEGLKPDSEAAQACLAQLETAQ